MADAARRASRALIRDFNEIEQLQTSRRGTADFLAAAMRRSAETLKAELSRARPGFAYLDVRGGPAPAADERRCWIVNPLQGADNFAHAIPRACISIAVGAGACYVAGVILDPLSDELYWAEKGQGAFSRDRRLRVSQRTRLDDCLIGHAIARRDVHDGLFARTDRVHGEVRDFRATGSVALDLAWLASGRLDGYWGEGLAPRDVAAGAVLVSEAGGRVTDAAGEPFGPASPSLLAGNSGVHERLLEVLAEP